MAGRECRQHSWKYSNEGFARAKQTCFSYSGAPSDSSRLRSGLIPQFEQWRMGRPRGERTAHPLPSRKSQKFVSGGRTAVPLGSGKCQELSCIRKRKLQLICRGSAAWGIVVQPELEGTRRNRATIVHSIDRCGEDLAPSGGRVLSIDILRITREKRNGD